MNREAISRRREASHSASASASPSYPNPRNSTMTEEVRFPPDALDLAIQRIMPRYYADEGHGHIWPRPDGERFRCGAARLCDTCRADARALDAARAEVARLAHLPNTDLSDERAIEVLRSVAKYDGWTEINPDAEHWQTPLRAMHQYAAGLRTQRDDVIEGCARVVDRIRGNYSDAVIEAALDAAQAAIRNLKSQDHPR